MLINELRADERVRLEGKTNGAKRFSNNGNDPKKGHGYYGTLLADFIVYARWL
jgi:hypothetical protein